LRRSARDGQPLRGQSRLALVDELGCVAGGGLVDRERDPAAARVHERDEHGRVAGVLRQRPTGRRFDADAVACAEVAPILAGAAACRLRGRELRDRDRGQRDDE